jgi:hypothetical protein
VIDMKVALKALQRQVTELERDLTPTGKADPRLNLEWRAARDEHLHRLGRQCPHDANADHYRRDKHIHLSRLVSCAASAPGAISPMMAI